MAAPLFAQGAGKRRAVQEHVVLAREVQDQVLCLASPSGGQRYEYRAILEVSGINYHLKSDEEQQFIADQFQRFLAGLNHPIQILVRVLPLNIEPSLRRLQLPSDGRPSVTSSLALAMVQFLRGLAAQRTTPTGEPVVLDWWAASQRNANRLIVAPPGAGKSFKTKLDILRMHLMMTCMGLRAYGLELLSLY
jgi:hypothetical protein